MSQPSLWDPTEMPCPTCHGTGRVPIGFRPTDPLEGMTGRDHPATSSSAGRRPSNRLRFGSQRHRAMLALRSARHTGLTAAEVASKISTSRNQAATRLLECRELGWVGYVVDEVSGRRVTRPTGPHDDGLVQQLTPHGRAILGVLDVVEDDS